MKLQKRHYTLIELIVTLAIIGIVGTIGIAFLIGIAFAIKYLFFAAIIPLPIIF